MHRRAPVRPDLRAMLRGNHARQQTRQKQAFHADLQVHVPSPRPSPRRPEEEDTTVTFGGRAVAIVPVRPPATAQPDEEMGPIERCLRGALYSEDEGRVARWGI